ncbi:MAG: hypothetical protein H7Z77_08150 [Chitinophagaceae bacterium]|nr:hypothetical protein [Polaromonas sp.]
MSQAIVCLKKYTLSGAKSAAVRARLSVSKRFAQFAGAEKQKPEQRLSRGWASQIRELTNLTNDEKGELRSARSLG